MLGALAETKEGGERFGERAKVGMDRDGLGTAAGLDERTVVRIEEGRVVSLKKVRAEMGASLEVRTEVYDARVDVLHLRVPANSAAYEQRLSGDEGLLASAVVLD